jgi:hypothetical protein
MPWTNPNDAAADAVTGQVAPASLWNTYGADNLAMLGRDIEPMRHVGTTDMEIWYPCGQPYAANTGITSTATFAVNTLQAVPFIAPRNSVIDRIAFETTNGQASTFGRAGIYKTVSNTNMYPGALVVDGGEFSLAAAGIKSATINTALPDCYYWAVLLHSASAVTFRVLLQNTPLLGFTSSVFTESGNQFLSRSQTYGALPSTFPASPATKVGGSTPLIAIRFSA